MDDLEALTRVVNDRFAEHMETLGGAPGHRVEFSRRVTSSWALIYYRQRLVRLSPYLFLLEGAALKRGSHWRELDATLRHEAAHAVAFDRRRETGHSPAFAALLRRLDVEPNGCCDLGPENAAFRYVYACQTCGEAWRRRLALRGNWSCGTCAPGRYDPLHRMALREHLGDPWRRVLAQRERIASCMIEAAADFKPRLVVAAT